MKVQWIFVVALTLTAIALFFVNFRIVKPEEKHSTDRTQGVRDNTQKELSGQKSSTQTDTRLRRLASGHVEYKPALEASRAISEVEKPREALVLHCLAVSEVVIGSHAVTLKGCTYGHWSGLSSFVGTPLAVVEFWTVKSYYSMLQNGGR